MENNLQTLIRSMNPRLNEGEYVFCALPPGSPVDLSHGIGWFREEEGLTLILPREQADLLNLSYTFVAAWITLTVHSALEAVGLTAAFSAALSEENISCNVVAACYHDHIFVAVHDKEKAMNILNKLSRI